MSSDLGKSNWKALGSQLLLPGAGSWSPLALVLALLASVVFATGLQNHKDYVLSSPPDVGFAIQEAMSPADTPGVPGAAGLNGLTPGAWGNRRSNLRALVTFENYGGCVR